MTPTDILYSWMMSNIRRTQSIQIHEQLILNVKYAQPVLVQFTFVFPEMVLGGKVVNCPR